MKYKSLFLMTSAAMAVSLCTVPIHAVYKIPITVNEIDVNNVPDTIYAGDSVETIYKSTVTLKTSDDTKIQLIGPYYIVEEYQNIDDAAIAGVNSDGSVVKIEDNTDPTKSISLPKFTTFDANNIYYYEIAYNIKYDQECTFDFSEYNKTTSLPDKEYSTEDSTKKIKIMVNGVDKTKDADVFINVSATGYGLAIFPKGGEFYVPVEKPAPTASTTPTAAPTATPAVEPAKTTTTEIYRLYNTNTGEHFYTSSTDERDMDVEAGWTYEGVGWNAPESGNPVYRMYNPVAGEHHYTMNEDEVAFLIDAGWNLESECAWYSAPAETGVPVYREYNPNQYACNHNYSPSTDERDYLISLGWKDEGIAWYASEN